jgi:hypothetical protein
MSATLKEPADPWMIYAHGHPSQREYLVQLDAWAAANDIDLRVHLAQEMFRAQRANAELAEALDHARQAATRQYARVRELEASPR